MKRSRKFVTIPYTTACIAVMAATISIPLTPSISGVFQGSVKTTTEVVGRASSPEKSGALQELRHHHRPSARERLAGFPPGNNTVPAADDIV